ncbi:hypothetical protein [Parachlamydia acanthamoebae]|uniref:Uncharacterized protein n=1 Tax=Parachlamydia acanthamoebae TaxID=83552 RepID=A0A0C1ECA4_9BACT|nr:hypothetical protein [Parachlamydia acanthamoebae]KIA78727.1 hypothetical protein DB43_DM00020 [Parachlamydia acanthamoebae]
MGIWIWLAASCVSMGICGNMFHMVDLNKLINIDSTWWYEILEFIQMRGRQRELFLEYIIGEFPVSVCRNMRKRVSKIYQGEDSRGFNVIKKYFMH